MKQFLIILFVAFGLYVSANAQEGASEPGTQPSEPGTQQGVDDLGLGAEGGQGRKNIERRLERNDRRTEHEKHREKPKTWVDRGIIYQDMFDVDTEFLYFGMAEDELTLFMGEPNEIRTEEVEFGVRKIMVYDNIEVYFEDGALVGYKEFDVMHDDPLTEAYACFQKAHELLEEEELNFFQRIFTADQERRMQDAYLRLYGQFVNQAVLEYEENDYPSAFESFSKAVEIADSPYYEEPIDESVVFNTGFVATLADKREEALKYYNMAKELGYEDANLYALISDSYMERGDTLNAENVLQEGFEKYPENNTILVELINFYLNADNAEDALDYLELAKEQEPDNPTFHYAEGTLYERLGESEKAMDAYERAIEIDPNLFEANFNLGVFYYNKAVDLLSEAQEITDNIEYSKAVEHASEVMTKSLPYLEKAHDVNPDDVNTMETLRIVYYRLGQEEELKEMYDKLGMEYDLDEDF